MPDQAGVQSGTASPDQSKFKIKVQGQEKEVTKEELIELAQKGDDYTVKTQTLAERERTLRAKEEKVAAVEKIVDEMNADPKLASALNKAYADVKSGKISTSEAADRSLKLIDRRLEETDDPALKEQLRDIRQIIKEESGVDSASFREEISKLRGEISLLRNATVVGQSERVESQLTKLEERFGKELVDKYRRDISSSAIKYPATSAIKLLYHFADEGEIKTALLNEAEKEKKEELERKKRGSAPGGEEGIVARTERQLDSAGRTTHKSIIERVKERAGLT